MSSNDSQTKTFCFDANLIQSGEIDASYVDFPFDVKECFGRKGMIKIEAVFDNQISYRGSLANMGTGCHILIVLKSIRQQLNKTFGDQIHICLWEDKTERLIEIPENLKELFQSFPEHALAFEKLSYTHRKEWTNFIAEAKRNETKEKRMTKLLAFLEEKSQAHKKKNKK